MKRRSRYTIICAAAGCAITALVVLVVVANWHAVHYRLFRDEVSFNAVLSQRVKPGDSIEHITTLLGRGRRLPEAERRDIVGGIAATVKKDPMFAPDGAAADDVIVQYPLEGGVRVNLQFRKGQLVNFNPKDWETPMTINVLSTGK